MAEILPIRRKTLSNQSINLSINQSINRYNLDVFRYWFEKKIVRVFELIEVTYLSNRKAAVDEWHYKSTS